MFDLTQFNNMSKTTFKYVKTLTAINSILYIYIIKYQFLFIPSVYQNNKKHFN